VCIGFRWGNLRESDHWETQAYMEEEYYDGYSGSGMWGYGLDWAGSGLRQVTSNCECGNESSGSIKFGEFLH
jgi:hypothetical protein